MNYEHINFSISDGYSVIELNRPEVLNSFNRQMAREFQDALISSRDDPEVRAILIRGTGKAFSAGQDLAEAIPKDGEPLDLGEIIEKSYNPIIWLIREIEKPIVAAVNGPAAGASANIALACDIVVAAESAYFLQAFSKIGLIPDSGGTYFLPRLIGLPRASALMLLGEKLSASDAELYGMIYKVFSDKDFTAESEKLAERLAKMPTKALGLIKNALNESFNNNLNEQLDLERILQIEASNSEDYKEGVSAFMEKRKPEFKGR